MTRSGHPRRFTRSDEAVSTVLGAILLLAIIAMFLVVVQVTFVPIWEEEEEAAQSRQVQGQLTAIQSELDRRLENNTAGPINFPITMGRDRASILQIGPNLPSEATLEEGQDAITWESNELLIQFRNGASLAGINETWTAVQSGTSITNVYDILHLRLRVYDPANQDENDAVSLEVVDGNGDLVGTFKVYIDTFPSGYAIKVQSSDGDGNVRHDEGESRFQQDAPAFHWVNVLQTDYVFSPLLAAAERPLTLNIQEDGMQGDFAIQYTQETAGGTTIVGASGLSIPDYQAGFIGGRFVHETFNQRFPSQKLVLEHGALILDQSDGTSMLVEPDFEVFQGVNTTVVAMAFTGLDGEPTTYSTTRPAAMRLGGIDAISYTATAPRFVVNLTTEYAALWEAKWDAELASGGLDEGAGEYNITTGATWAKLAIYGTTPAPASTEHDLTLRLRQATVQATLNV